jgi:FkbM family methyltransferase
MQGMSEGINGVYLGDYRALARTIFDHRIFVDTRDVSIAPHLLFEGKWEHWITNAMGPLLRGAFFVDVGANFGWYSLLAAHTEARKIVAFEPNPRIFELLSQTMLVNGIQCDLYRKAVGDKEDEIALQVDWMRVGGATLLERRRTMDGWEALLPEVEEKIPVEVVVLGKVLEQTLQKDAALRDIPMVLKVDVEGFEPRVVLGAREILRGLSCTAFVEYHSDPDGAGKLREMLDFFDSAQYSLSHVQHDSKLKPISRAELDQLPEAEMVCFRRFPR